MNRPLPSESTENKITLGRAPDRDVQLHHLEVSRKHAVIRREKNDVYISDSGSSFGVLVNGKVVTQARLSPDDEIQIGPFLLLYNGRSIKWVTRVHQHRAQ